MKHLIANSISAQNILAWAEQFDQCCALFSNDSTANYDFLIAASASQEIIPAENCFEELRKFYNEKPQWLFGFFSYDLKNEVEHLSSENFDGIQLPQLYFFVPEFLFISKNGKLTVHYPDYLSETEAAEIINDVKTQYPAPSTQHPAPNIQPRITKEEYLQTVRKFQEHIQFGAIYEANFCQEFFAENAEINPLNTFLKLREISPTPFSAFYKFRDKYLLCASPERFLKKEGNKIISQPIKGTAKRGKTDAEDAVLKSLLLHDVKEQSENVMVVDLVRNDLSRTAKDGTVIVDELFGIYTFSQVHQMISTISAELRDDVHFIDAIKEAFPMGSMTGCPKIKAMELIEKYETTKRGLFSGAVGYITPNGDFDFNVVIRSMLYNAFTKYLSMMAGSAITAKSIPEKEYEECLMKAKAMFEVLGVQLPESELAA